MAKLLHLLLAWTLLHRLKVTLARLPLLLLLGLCAVCTGTPQTDPPQADVDLNADLVDVTAPPRTRALEQRVVRGAANAATPPGASVHVVNLDSNDPPAVAVVAEDGSFSADIVAADGDELRIQVRNADDRTDPLDVIVEEETLSPRSRVLSCFRLQPQLELEFDASGGESTATLELVNDCDEVLVVSRVELRTEGSGFSVSSAPAEVSVRSSASVVLAYAAGAGASEEILFVEVAAPEVERRPITLITENE